MNEWYWKNITQTTLSRSLFFKSWSHKKFGINKERGSLKLYFHYFPTQQYKNINFESVHVGVRAAFIGEIQLNQVVLSHSIYHNTNIVHPFSLQFEDILWQLGKFHISSTYLCGVAIFTQKFEGCHLSGFQNTCWKITHYDIILRFMWA